MKCIEFRVDVESEIIAWEVYQNNNIGNVQIVHNAFAKIIWRN